MASFGKFMIIAGVILIIIGLIIVIAGNKLNWIGHLPGDIRIEKENFRLYFPVTTMILASILLSAIFWIIRKLF